MKLKKGDKVKVTGGKDNGKEAKIERVFLAENKVLLPEINVYKRHLKARTEGQKSEIVTMSRPLAVANVALICPKCNVQTRVGYKLIADKKVRVCRKCNQEID